MKLSNLTRCAAVIAAPLIIAISADAAPVAYRYTQAATDISLRTGYLASTSGPVTFDFVLPFALAPSRSYSFGYLPIDLQPDGSLVSFSFNGGSALANFSGTDFPAAYTSYGSAFRTKAFLTLSTGADSRITKLGVVLENNVPAIDPVFEFRDISVGYQEGVFGRVDESFYNGRASRYEAALSGRGSGGSIVLVAPSHSGVPEPATWALMIAGLALVGLRLRCKPHAGMTARAE